MGWALKIQYGGSNYDISDYIDNSFSFPLYERNRNGEPIVTQFDININGAINSNYIAEGGTIWIEKDGWVKFSGFIDKRNYKLSEGIWMVTAKSRLSKLQQKTITRANIESVLKTGATSTQYKYPDNWTGGGYSYGHFQLLWVLDRMQNQVGASIDVYNLEGVQSGGMTYFEQIAIDMNVIFNLNINYATLSEPDGQDALSLITYWDFFSVICGYFNVAIVPSTNALYAYELVHINSLSSYSDVNDDIYDGEESSVIPAQAEALQFGCYYAGRGAYYSTSKTDLTNPSNIPENSIPVYLPMNTNLTWIKRKDNRSQGLVKFYNNLFFHKKVNIVDNNLDLNYYTIYESESGYPDNTSWITYPIIKADIERTWYRKERKTAITVSNYKEVTSNIITINGSEEVSDLTIEWYN